MSIRDEIEALYGDKYFLIIGMDNEKVLLLDTRTNQTGVIARRMVRNYLKFIANLETDSKDIEVSDISKTRLNRIAEGVEPYFIYVVKRYKDNKDNTKGYLAYLISHNRVQLSRLPKEELENFFTTLVVLNAKRTEKEGKIIVSGIKHNIPEELDTTTQSKQADEVSKEEVHYKHKYLNKVEKAFEYNFLQNGYSTKIGYTRDWTKKVQRYVNEVIRVHEPLLYQWFEKNKNILRAIQTIDAFMALKLSRGEFNERPTQLKSPFVKSVVSKQGYGDFSKDFLKSQVMVIYSGATSGIPTRKIDTNHLNSSGRNVLTYSREGLISVSDVSAIQDAKALLEGHAIGELEIYHLNGVLATELELLPIPKEAKQFLKLRDHIAISPNKHEMESLVAKIPATTGVRLLKSCMRKHFLAKDYIVKGFDEGIVEVNTEYKNEFIPQTVDWASTDAFRAMNVDYGGTTIEDTGFKMKDTSIFYKKNKEEDGLFVFSGKPIFKKQIDKEFTHTKCVGDYILLHQIMTRNKTVNDTNKMSDKDVMKRYALLVLGNKELAKEVSFTNYLPVTVFEQKELDDLPNSNTIAYQTGGRLGDKQMAIYYTKCIPYKDYGKLAKDTIDNLHKILQVVAPSYTYTDYELETIY